MRSEDGGRVTQIARSSGGGKGNGISAPHVGGTQVREAARELKAWGERCREKEKQRRGFPCVAVASNGCGSGCGKQAEGGEATGVPAKNKTCGQRSNRQPRRDGGITGCDNAWTPARRACRRSVFVPSIAAVAGDGIDNIDD